MTETQRETMTETETANRATSLRLCGLSVLLLLAVAGGLSAIDTAAGQEVTLNESESSDDAEQVEDTLGQLIIRNTEYVSDDEGRITVEWTGEAPESLRHTQLDVDNEQISTASARLLPGETTTLSVELVSDDPSLIWTEESVDENQIHVVKWTDRGESRSVPLWQGVLFGGSTFALATVLVAWKRLNTYGEPQEGW